MHRSSFSRVAALALAAAAVILFACDRLCTGAGRTATSLYHLGAAWMVDMVHRIPAPLASPHEPTGTANQRSWLVSAAAYQARRATKRAPAIEAAWRMCPST